MNRRQFSLTAFLAAMCAPMMGQKSGTLRVTGRDEGECWRVTGGTEVCYSTPPHDHSPSSPYWKETPFGFQYLQKLKEPFTFHDGGVAESIWLNTTQLQACSLCGILRVPPELQKFIGKKVIE